MAKYKAYPEYKDSGVEWLGELPARWKTLAIKHVARLNPSKSCISLEKMKGMCSFIPMEKLKFNSLSLDEIKDVSDVYNGYTYFEDEDILIAKVTPCFENKNMVVAHDLNNGIGFGSSEIYVLRCNDIINNYFLFYRLQEDNFMSIAEGAMTGAGGLKRVPSEILNNFKFGLPSKKEQSIIVNFLKHETAKIDNLIEKQQQLIELLKEKRQAVISHAVTKGLNPDVPIKDSGVEWLGPISQHCIITKLKYLTVLKTEKTVSNNIRYVGMENISSGTGKFLSKDEMTPEGTSVSFECNDVLFGKLRPYLAKSWLATFSGICSSEFLVLQPKKIHARYLNYYLLTNEFIKQVDSSTYGSKMPRANWDFISQLPVPTWTYEESKAIAVYLDNLTAKLDCLLEKQNQQVSLLQERRTALISAAVTGKIDVRDWVAPDTQDVEEPQEATA
ncbi:restriction endonuclease subunit S [Pantoea agglomerans]|uniref:restriction endonuclease subunit S n=1 Tax=Enterobacter agglomerans TaxID=549 RepID=UPI000DADF38A|nr:restriction endonuclease subunit S [Pantoea agglomerans]MCL9650660.1 restriction endonuclease subunit S [Pantoea agglomerans]RAH29981.1 restriction endonuclease subunit S [Pantoea agglomerans]TGX91158.1 restriction endonuclease subunit S [Pantoea agglomerans]